MMQSENVISEIRRLLEDNGAVQQDTINRMHLAVTLDIFESMSEISTLVGHTNDVMEKNLTSMERRLDQVEQKVSERVDEAEEKLDAALGREAEFLGGPLFWYIRQFPKRSVAMIAGLVVFISLLSPLTEPLARSLFLSIGIPLP